MSGSAKQIPHTTVESIIFHKSNLLIAFYSMMSHHGPVIIRTVFITCRRTYREVVLSARLVEAEIVSPHCRILINTGAGNPIVPPIMALGGISIFSGQVGRHRIFAAFIRG